MRIPVWCSHSPATDADQSQTEFARAQRGLRAVQNPQFTEDIGHVVFDGALEPGSAPRRFLYCSSRRPTGAILRVRARKGASIRPGCGEGRGRERRLNSATTLAVMLGCRKDSPRAAAWMASSRRAGDTSLRQVAGGTCPQSFEYSPRRHRTWSARLPGNADRADDTAGGLNSAEVRHAQIHEHHQCGLSALTSRKASSSPLAASPTTSSSECTDRSWRKPLPEERPIIHQHHPDWFHPGTATSRAKPWFRSTLKL